MVRGALAADADVLAVLAAGADRHRSIAFTAASRSSKLSATSPESRSSAERELGEVVRADREAVEVLEELVGQDRVGRQLAHHDDPEAVLAPLEAVLRQELARPRCASPTVRTNGTISSTLVRPSSSRTLRIAAHSSSKQSRKSGAM